MYENTFTRPSCAGLLCVGLLLGSPTFAADEPDSASDKKSAAKNVKVSGVFEALNSEEISPHTKHIKSLEIKRIVPHGTKVSKGKNIILLETKEIDKQIKQAETDLRLAKLTLDDDQYAYTQFLETQKLDKEAAERARKQAQQVYDNFVQVDRERQLKSAEFNLKSSQASLENAKEELKQLEQMYQEDDLTEESEEIVLKRAKRSVEVAEYRLEGTQIQTDRTVNQDVPRSQLQQDDALARAELKYQQAIRDLASARQRREIEMGQKRDKFKEQQEQFDELKAERKRVVLACSMDGIVLHGKLTRGKLSDKPSLLKKGTKVTGEQVLATVVNPDKLQIRATVEEQHLHVVKAGTKCKVTTKAVPDFETVGTVKSVSPVPFAGTKYDAVVTFRRPKDLPQVMPTMTCDLEFEVAGHDDDDDDDDDGNNNPDRKAKQETE